MIVALATVATANPLFYTYPTAGSTVVRSDRLGGNFAYSIHQGPVAFPYPISAPVGIKAVPAYGFSFGYPEYYSPVYPGYSPISLSEPAVSTSAKAPVTSTDENQAEIVEAAY